MNQSAVNDWLRNQRDQATSGSLITESFGLQIDDLLHRACIELQLAPTQHEQATQHYNAMADWLERDGSSLAVFAPKIYPQGSFRVLTTVRPVPQREFDLDLVCELQLDPRRVLNPASVIVAVERRLQQHGRYEVMIDPKKRPRCVRVRYANNFHLDIVPARPDPDPFASDGAILIPDRELKTWQPSNPKGFAKWFEDRAKHVLREFMAKAMPIPGYQPIEAKPPLKRAVQLIKRWRDIAFLKDMNLAPSSIVLTTLAGVHYRAQESVYAAISGILDGILRAIPRAGRLAVMNPVSCKEDLSDAWGCVPGAYDAFVNRIGHFHRVWRKLEECRGIHEASSLLAVLFGTEPIVAVVKAQAEMLEAARGQRLLGVDRKFGLIRPAGAVGTVPWRKNTYYGE